MKKNDKVLEDVPTEVIAESAVVTTPTKLKLKKKQLIDIVITNMTKNYETVDVKGAKHILFPSKSLTIKSDNANVLANQLKLRYKMLTIKVGV